MTLKFDFQQNEVSFFFFLSHLSALSCICGTLNKDKEQFAEDLEDTAIVIPAVIPWSIACAIVLAATSAPLASIPYAFYLYLLPLWKLIHTTFSRRSKSK